jgi:hypothetical protein
MRDAETRMEAKIDETQSSATDTDGIDCTCVLLTTRHALNTKETASSWTANVLLQKDPFKNPPTTLL